VIIKFCYLNETNVKKDDETKKYNEIHR